MQKFAKGNLCTLIFFVAFGVLGWAAPGPVSAGDSDFEDVEVVALAPRIALQSSPSSAAAQKTPGPPRRKFLSSVNLNIPAFRALSIPLTKSGKDLLTLFGLRKV